MALLGRYFSHVITRRIAAERIVGSKLRLLLVAIMFSIIAYQFFSFLLVSSLDDQSNIREHSFISSVKKSSYVVHKSPQFEASIPPLLALPKETKKEINKKANEITNEVINKALSARKPRENISFLRSKAPEVKTVRPLCNIPTQLGPIPVNTSDIALANVEKKFSVVKWGGRYSPHYCMARSRVAIIVPYRDRKKNLATFLNHMHPFLIKQKLEYRIYVVEQKGNHEFNRGKLMNVGFSEAGHWQCYIFHDIDLLPIDERNIYSCPHPKYPRLLDVIAGLDKDALKLAVRGSFGGVSALTHEQFSKINGYSNGYWGWGGEDNDLYYRLTRSGYTVTQYNLPIARYTSIHHKQKSQNPRRYRLLLQTIKAFQLDGLSNLRYELESITHYHLYTHILVSIDHTYHELQELFNEHYQFESIKFDIVSRANLVKNMTHQYRSVGTRD